MRYAVLLSLLLLAATTLTPTDTLRITYGEPDILSPQLQYPFDLPTLTRPQSDLIDVFSFSAIVGTRQFAITAGDYQNNRAVHYESITVDTPLNLELLEPSVHGVADSAVYGLAVTADSSATCSWKFVGQTPGTNMQEEEFTHNQGVFFLDYTFSQKYRFPEGELVPVQITCSAGDLSEQLIAYIGWSDEVSTPTPTLRHMPTGNRGDLLTLDVHTQEPTTCTLYWAGSEVATSTLTDHHVFRELQQRSDEDFTVSCIDAHGIELPLLDVADPLNTGQDVPVITVRSPSKVQEGPYQLIVETSIPARCTETLTGAKLGYLDDGREHQATLTLNETVSGNIVCSKPQATQTATQAFAIEVLDDEAVFAIQTAEYCADTDETLLEVSYGPEVAYVVLEESVHKRTQVRRQPNALIRQADIGSEDASITVRAITHTGVVSSEIATLTAASDCDVPEFNDITLREPSSGVSEAENFTLEVATVYAATCEISAVNANPQSFDMTTSDDLSHYRDNIQEALTRGAVNDVEITCTSDASTRTETFQIGWDLEEPTLTLSADPEVVTDLANPQTLLTAQSNQPVRCSLDEGAQTREYKQVHTYNLSISQGNRTVFVECENLAGETVNDTISFRENYPSEMTLRILTEDITSNLTVPLGVRSTHLATCRVTGLASPLALSTVGSFVHEREQTLSEGSYDLTYTCAQTDNPNKTRSESQALIVDRTPPEVDFATGQYTCGLNRFVVRLNATDNVAIDQFLITFDERNYTTDNPVYTIKRLRLEENQTYTLRAIAYDTAGLASDPVEDSIIAKSEDFGSCDDEKPTALIGVTELLNGANITVYCEDNVGCDEDFKIGFTDPKASCSVNTATFQQANDTTSVRSDPFTINESQKVCIEVFDYSGNSFSKDELIEVIDYSGIAHCSNSQQDADETGVDCGGSCPSCVIDPDLSCSNGVLDAGETDIDCGGIYCDKCDAGLSCDGFADCSSRSCTNGICAAPTCTDSKQNGQETGRDCGGPDCDACAEGNSCVDDTDCATGLVCSYGTCSSDPGDRYDPDPDVNDPFIPNTSSGPALGGIIMIVLGVLAALGGGGWMYWGSSHPPAQQPAAQPRGDVLEHAQEQDVPDFSQSKLREEARTQRLAKRDADRDALINAFDEQEEPPADEEETDAEDVFSELEEIANSK